MVVDDPDLEKSRLPYGEKSRTSPSSITDLLRDLEIRARNRARREWFASRRWIRWNYVLGSLAAIGAGTAGATTLAAQSGTLRTIAGALALFAGALGGIAHRERCPERSAGSLSGSILR